MRKEYNRVIKCNLHQPLMNKLFLSDRVSSLQDILSVTKNVKTSSYTPSGKMTSFCYCSTTILYAFSVSSSSITV